MRVLRVVFTTALLLALAGNPAQAAKAKPPLVRLRWSLVARGVTSLDASDRYLAYATSTGMTLVDQQTHARSELDFSPCPDAQPPYPLLGGPWVAECGQFGTPFAYYNGAAWDTVPYSGCRFCAPIAIGSQWIELLDNACPQPHCVAATYLQNITTGAVESDPVQPHVSFREDLDSPTGTSPLCAPLRYPALVDRSVDQLEPGRLTMLGQFALTTFGNVTNVLERCHSKWRVRLNGPALGSSQMIVWGKGLWEWPGTRHHGLLMPSLRRFDFYVPRRVQPAFPTELALSGRTFYVLNNRHVLWAARVRRIR